MEKKKSLIFNYIIIITEIIGFILVIKANGKISYEYYTEDSNLLALFSSIIYVYFLHTNKKIPRWAQMLKYISTIGITLTLLVVIFILAPMFNFAYDFMLFSGFSYSLLFHHLLCPIIGIISFLKYDNIDNLSKYDLLKGMSFTFIYGIILIILNICEIISGPYPFLKVAENSSVYSIIWITIVLGMAYIIAKVFKNIKNKKSIK